MSNATDLIRSQKEKKLPSQLLEESAGPFDEACMLVRQMEFVVSDLLLENDRQKRENKRLRERVAELENGFLNPDRADFMRSLIEGIRKQIEADPATIAAKKKFGDGITIGTWMDAKLLCNTIEEDVLGGSDD